MAIVSQKCRLGAFKRGLAIIIATVMQQHKQRQKKCAHSGALNY